MRTRLRGNFSELLRALARNIGTLFLPREEYWSICCTNKFFLTLLCVFIHLINFSLRLKNSTTFLTQTFQKSLRKYFTKNQDFQQPKWRWEVSFQNKMTLSVSRNKMYVIWHEAGIYLFKVNNRNIRTRCEICSTLTIKTLAIGVVLVSLLLTLNIFHTLF